MALEDYYETQSVSAGRANYSCECCGGSIPKGTPSDVHKFYPEFNGIRTHQKYSKKFLAGHYCCECGAWLEDGTEIMHGKNTYCSECHEDIKEEPVTTAPDKKLSENYFSALKRPDDYHSLPLTEQWAVDERLGILDWDPTPYEIEQYNSKKGR